MAEFLSDGPALNELLQECYALNRSLVEAAQQLTEGTGITGAQWGVLSALNQAPEPRSVAETARRMGLARQSVQRVADLLEGLALVHFLPDPADKRARLVAVTPQGQRLLDRLEGRQLRWVRQVTGEHRAADIAAAARLLRDMRERISASAPPAERVA